MKCVSVNLGVRTIYTHVLFRDDLNVPFYMKARQQINKSSTEKDKEAQKII